MLRTLLLNCFIFCSLFSVAETITVKNGEELSKANKNAKPGDVIILKNGTWQDVEIKLNSTGTKEQPVTFKAETAGKVIFSGKSNLKLGGSFIIVDGLYFANGYAGSDAVITFRIDKKQLANNCRVTNTVINDFNNPKRMDENYWIAFYGKNNRLDHCSFLNKKNMGVLLAVILDDERSRENFHSIDHNHFGVRLPLASNSGEIIRVGVSQHCEFNSNTQITDNFFDKCDGETEIVSIKSGSNVVRNNLFLECQGGVVLRHGNFNTVEGNVFLGNGKAGTGGVRIINKGQWVVNNFFSQCRGTGFRSPLSIMNGVPNSPAFRYVAVTDAVVANNSFIDCAPISLCEGSDTERSVIPQQVIFQNNVFKNNIDSKIYNAYDDISGITFISNAVNASVKQDLAPGFAVAKETKSGSLPGLVSSHSFSDSLLAASKSRLSGKLSPTGGFSGTGQYQAVKNNAANSGAKWFGTPSFKSPKKKIIDCPDAASLSKALSADNPAPLTVRLTGQAYMLDAPFIIRGNVTITSNKKPVAIGSSRKIENLFEIKGNSYLTISQLNADMNHLQAGSVVSSDVTGTSNHSNFSVQQSQFKNVNGSFFTAAKSVMLDSIVIINSSFTNVKETVFNFTNETDKKGYYSVEKLKILNNNFTQNSGTILNMLRGGNDESTMGPLLIFTGNTINDCNVNEQPLIRLYGTQVSSITGNKFTGSNKNGVLIQFEDAVRAAHLFTNNTITGSGKVVTNKYVTDEKNNITQ